MKAKYSKLKQEDSESPLSSSTSIPDEIGEMLETYKVVDTSQFEETTVDPQRLPNIDWVDIFKITEEKRKKFSPKLQKQYYLLLQTSVTFWSLREYENLHRNCQCALAHADQLDLFLVFCFTCLDLVAYYEDRAEAKNVLDLYLKASRKSKEITFWERECLFWLGQIVSQRDMEKEMRACLGMSKLNSSKSFVKRRQAVLEEGLFNLGLWTDGRI